MKNFPHISLFEELNAIETPFYLYDMNLLNRTLNKAKEAADKRRYFIHYALKANNNNPLLIAIRERGFGVDCVSGNEVSKALEMGFSPDTIDFAGIGKTDEEIETALNAEIFSLNVESIEELEVIDEIAGKIGKIANVSLRINPNIDAHTHKNITTGLSENKFGLDLTMLPKLVDRLHTFKNVELKGLHFHVGSQILDLNVFKELAQKASQLNHYFYNQGFKFKHINMGGGLGVSYKNPSNESIVDFEAFFKVFEENLSLPQGMKVHFELGRALIAQSGILITKVVFVKKGLTKKFLILDGGMTDLIRPALYQAFHLTENICREEVSETYDVVGPICESTDCFGENLVLSTSYRGDLVAIYTTGAYGQVMSSKYNMRDKAKAYYVANGILYTEKDYLHAINAEKE